MAAGRLGEGGPGGSSRPRRVRVRGPESASHPWLGAPRDGCYYLALLTVAGAGRPVPGRHPRPRAGEGSRRRSCGPRNPGFLQTLARCRRPPPPAPRRRVCWSPAPRTGPDPVCAGSQRTSLAHGAGGPGARPPGPGRGGEARGRGGGGKCQARASGCPPPPRPFSGSRPGPGPGPGTPTPTRPNRKGKQQQ